MKAKLVCVKKIVSLFLLCVAVSGFSQTQTNVLIGNLSSFGGFNAYRTNVTMTLTLIAPKNRRGISNDPIQATTDANGNFGFTNVYQGYYGLTASDSSGTRWPIGVWVDTTGSNNIYSLVNWALTVPPNNWSNYLTAAQTLALVQSASGTPLTASATTTIGNSNGSNTVNVVTNIFDLAGTAGNVQSNLLTLTLTNSMYATFVPVYTNVVNGQTNVIVQAVAGAAVVTNGAAIRGVTKLAHGTNQVACPFVQYTSSIILTYQSQDGTLSALTCRTNEIIPLASFTIRSSNSSDTNPVNWFLIP